VADVPGRVSEQLASNLSVPIMFVCLLHLANEKTLRINNVSGMNDLAISLYS
jgi:condensin complex subunit 2